jgi:hypothetical protein
LKEKPIFCQNDSKKRPPSRKEDVYLQKLKISQ